MSAFRDEEVLIFEPVKMITSIRIMMVAVCVLIGLATLINLILTYKKHEVSLKPCRFYRFSVPLILLCNILVHVAHYAHNIYDPAGYYEPKHLYDKVLFSEMERTFLFNFPLSITFIIATRLLLSSCAKPQAKSRTMLAVVILYCLMSMISGGHYTYEPPRNFSLLHNMTIAGETFAAFVLLLVGVFVYRSSATQTASSRYTRLAMDEYGDHAKESMTSQRLSKAKLSDGE